MAALDSRPSDSLVVKSHVAKSHRLDVSEELQFRRAVRIALRYCGVKKFPQILADETGACENLSGDDD
jgi:hypothetical protein